MTRPAGLMALRKQKGDLAELMVAADLLRRGYKIAIPYGEAWDVDLVLCRDDGKLERVQVKHATSDGQVIQIECRSQCLTGGRLKATKRYTAETVDWLAAYDATTKRCYYVPAVELDDGRTLIHLRLTPPRNNQRARVRLAADYLEL